MPKLFFTSYSIRMSMKNENYCRLDCDRLNQPHAITITMHTKSFRTHLVHTQLMFTAFYIALDIVMVVDGDDNNKDGGGSKSCIASLFYQPLEISAGRYGMQ